jgi:hypothetical protein
LGGAGGAAGSLGGYLGGQVGGAAGADIGRTGASTLANFYLSQALNTTPGGGVAKAGTSPTSSSAAIASLLSTPSDPGYSAPLMGTQSDSEKTGPSPWNQSSLRTTDATGNVL